MAPHTPRRHDRGRWGHWVPWCVTLLLGVSRCRPWRAQKSGDHHPVRYLYENPMKNVMFSISAGEPHFLNFCETQGRWQLHLRKSHVRAVEEVGPGLFGDTAMVETVLSQGKDRLQSSTNLNFQSTILILIA